MPYEYAVYHEHRLIHEQAVGTVTDDEFIQSFTGPTADSPLDLSYSALSDYRRCKSEITIEAIKQAAEIYTAYYSQIPHGKWAIIASGKGGDFRAQFFTYFADNPDIRCFTSVRDALSWLNLPEDLVA